jgi:hypothetical protein
VKQLSNSRHRGRARLHQQYGCGPGRHCLSAEPNSLLFGQGTLELSTVCNRLTEVLVNPSLARGGQELFKAERPIRLRRHGLPSPVHPVEDLRGGLRT